MDYVSIGFFLVIFILELIILWYQWWSYSSLYSQNQDTQDILINVYTLQVFDMKKTNPDLKMELPKRVHDRISK